MEFLKDIGNFISDAWSSISSGFSNLFNGGNSGGTPPIHQPTAAPSDPIYNGGYSPAAAAGPGRGISPYSGVSIQNGFNQSATYGGVYSGNPQVDRSIDAGSAQVQRSMGQLGRQIANLPGDIVGGIADRAIREVNTGIQVQGIHARAGMQRWMMGKMR